MAWAIDANLPISISSKSGIEDLKVSPWTWAGGAGTRGMVNYYALGGGQVQANGQTNKWLWLAAGLLAGFILYRLRGRT